MSLLPELEIHIIMLLNLLAIAINVKGENDLKGEFTAIIEIAPEGGYWAISPEIPGANGQGETIEEAKKSLKISHTVNL